MPEWMAPEVALGKTSPHSDTDLYSLALILFYLWVWEHPMEGKKTWEVRCWDLPAKRRFYAESPVFAFHPTDRSNAAEGMDNLRLMVQRWTRLCPQRLKDAFLTSFVHGVHDRNKRLRTSYWIALFHELMGNLVKCDCGFENIADAGFSEPPRCLKCEKALPINLRLIVDNERYLAIYSGARLEAAIVKGVAAHDNLDRLLGEVEAHPNVPGAHILRNRTQQSWRYEAQGQTLTIDPGEARPLVADARLEIEGKRIFVKGW